MNKHVKRACGEREHDVFKETEWELVWMICSEQEVGGSKDELETTRHIELNYENHHSG